MSHYFQPLEAQCPTMPHHRRHCVPLCSIIERAVSHYAPHRRCSVLLCPTTGGAVFHYAPPQEVLCSTMPHTGGAVFHYAPPQEVQCPTMPHHRRCCVPLCPTTGGAVSHYAPPQEVLCPTMPHHRRCCVPLCPTTGGAVSHYAPPQEVLCPTMPPPPLPTIGSAVFHSLLPHHIRLWISLVTLTPRPQNWSSEGCSRYIAKVRVAVCNDGAFCWLVACLTSKQHASVSQGRICTDNCTCCHTEIEVAGPTFYLTH